MRLAFGAETPKSNRISRLHPGSRGEHMSYHMEKKIQIAKQLGISVAVLEQYLELKQAEASGEKIEVGVHESTVRVAAAAK